MGKSAISCFNILTCSRDSAGYDDLELLESRATSDRRRWSFRKRSAQNRILSNSIMSEPLPAISNDRECPEACHNTSYPAEDTFSFEKISSPRNMDDTPHFPLDTVCSKVGTSLVTEERIKTDADVKESAVTVIQAAIRSYMAHKEMKKLKSVIKLQATVRGHLVRRQAASTLRCVLAIIKMQTLVRARFVHHSLEISANQRKHDVMHETECERSKSLDKESSGTKHKKTYSATEKLLTNGFARQLFESTPKTKPIHIDCDPSRSDSSWKWLERWMALASLDIGQKQELNTNCTDQDQSTNTRLDVPELENEASLVLGPVSADSQSGSILPAHGAQLSDNCASDFEFQAPTAIMDESLCPPLKAHQGYHQPKNDFLNVAQDSHTRDEATNECSNLNSVGMILQSSSVSQSPDSVTDKSEFEKENSNHIDCRVECESLEAEGKKTVFEIRKVCNPAFLVAQSKFKDLCSAGSLNSVGTSNKDASVGSRPDNSPLDYFTKGNGSFIEDSTSHVPGGQTATSECDTELSISSTLDSPDRSEAEGGEIVLEIGAFESRDFDVNGGSDNASKNLNPEVKSLSAPETLQPPMLEITNENAINMIAADDSVQLKKPPSLEQHLAEPILSDIQIQQENVKDQVTCMSSPKGSPRRSHITAMEPHETPSSQISLNTNKINSENNTHERKPRSQLAGKRSLSNLNNDSGGRSSTERLPKSSKNGEKRNSFGMPKFDHADHEPKVSDSNSLPNYMQPTESARAKVHASNSPKSSTDVPDNDSCTKKRHSAPLGNGKQASSPPMQQSPSQMQQNVKGNGPNSTHNSAERKWQR